MYIMYIIQFSLILQFVIVVVRCDLRYPCIERGEEYIMKNITWIVENNEELKIFIILSPNLDPDTHCPVITSITYYISKVRMWYNLKLSD